MKTGLYFGTSIMAAQLAVVCGDSTFAQGAPEGWACSWIADGGPIGCDECALTCARVVNGKLQLALFVPKAIDATLVAVDAIVTRGSEIVFDDAIDISAFDLREPGLYVVDETELGPGEGAISVVESNGVFE